ncbi:MAG: hypothetical protein IJG09_08315 [Methanobrevibacter sp.]|nr:hypothetical protein [Methanobrevibacter sp.]
MSKISSFYIGSENSSGCVYDNVEDFIEALKEEIEIAENAGQEHFDITIEPVEC